MAKPIIKAITPIDASNSFNINCTYTGALPSSNKVVIYNAESLSIVYTQTTTTHFISPACTIPAGTLQNGKRYAVEITFYDADGTASAPSNKEYFLTLTTPTFYLSDGGQNIEGELTRIKNSSISLELNYDQEQLEDLYNFQFFLYDADRNLLDSSDIKFDYYTNNVHIFKGLDNNTTYFVQAKGLTVHNISCDTGLLKIYTEFKNPSAYAKIYAETDANGTIHGHTNILIVEPEDPDPGDYQFEDGFIQLLDRDIVYSEGFEIHNDFTISFKIKNINPNSRVLYMKSGPDIIVLENFSYTMGDKNYTVFRLTVPGPLDDYVLYQKKDVGGQLLQIKYSDVTEVHIRKVNGIYGLYIVPDRDASGAFNNMWFGAVRPRVGAINSDIYINLDKPTEAVKVFGDDVVVYYNENVVPTDGKNTIITPDGVETTTTTLTDFQIWLGEKEEFD